MIDLSIIIINYNGASFIEGCVDSIFVSETTFSYEVVVLDNASQDDSLSVLKRYGDQIKVVSSKDNLGFSRGNNEAEKYCTGKVLFLLNNDTVLEKDTLQKLYDFLMNTPDAGAISPKLLHKDGRLQCPGSVLGHWRFKSKVPCSVPFIAGAAVMIQRSIYNEMGGMDGNLFFYNDDIDFCKSLKKLGYKIYYVPMAQLLHYGGLSTRTRKLGSLIEGYRGGLYIAYKHYPRWVYHLYRGILLLDVVPRLLGHAFLSLFRAASRSYLSAYFTILKIDFLGDIFLENNKK